MVLNSERLERFQNFGIMYIFFFNLCFFFLSKGRLFGGILVGISFVLRISDSNVSFCEMEHLKFPGLIARI